MDNRQLEAALTDMAQIMELRGANTFRVRAYQNGARTVGALQEDVATLLAEGRLAQVKGIGKGLQERLAELVAGDLSYLAELREGVPEGLFDVLRVPGLGPKRTRLLWEQLDVVSLETLEAACLEGRVRALKGFAAKSEEKILEGLAHLALTGGRRLRSQALPHAAALVERLQALAEVERIEVAGSLRRGRETVKDVDVLVAARAPAPVMEAVLTWERVEGVIGSGSTKTSVRLTDGLQVDVRVVVPESFACGLAYFTGSKEFNVALRSRALEQGYSLNEYLLRPLDGSKPPEISSEAALHEILGLRYIEPHLRETPDGIEAAAQGTLPTLLEPGDLQGILHVHTRWSDGAATVEEVVAEAERLGYAYVGISDHSAASVWANGIGPEQLRRQAEEVEAAREAHPKIRVLHGVECDILANGSLDLDAECRASLDFVIASVHTQLNMDREPMTARLVRALADPSVKVLGHPENRLLLEREASEFDWEAVLDAAAEHGVAIELNAHPKRLDASWVRIRRIRARGVKLCISPDAHSLEGLDHARQYGVIEARRGWACAEDVVNTLPAERFVSEFLAR